MTDDLRHNAHLVESLGSALRSGSHGLTTAPMLLRTLLTEQRWERFVTRLGDEALPRSFEEFVTTPPLRGLGADLDLIRRIIGDDFELRDLLDRALQRSGGRPAETVSDRHGSRPAGETSEAALRRLRKDRPDLHERVVAGELSPHAAAVTAGFRTPRFSIPVDPERAAPIIGRHLTRSEIARLIDLLSDSS